MSFRLDGSSVKPSNAGRSADPKQPATGGPLGGLIPRRLVEHPELVMLSNPHSLAAEKFRRLKTLILNELARARVIVVTSPSPGEGKSVVAANLALAFAADTKERVALVDCDVRVPRINGWLEPGAKFGVAEVLTGRVEFERTLLDLKNSRLKVLPAGARVAEPLELFASDRARDMMSALRERFQRVIVDTPPIIRFTDADAIASLSDGVLMVVRSGSTPAAAYAQALSMITSAPVLGTVLNGTTHSLADRHRYYDDYDYAYYYDDKPQKSG